MEESRGGHRAGDDHEENRQGEGRGGGDRERIDSLQRAERRDEDDQDEEDYQPSIFPDAAAEVLIQEAGVIGGSGHDVADYDEIDGQDAGVVDEDAGFGGCSS